MYSYRDKPIPIYMKASTKYTTNVEITIKEAANDKHHIETVFNDVITRARMDISKIKQNKLIELLL